MAKIEAPSWGVTSSDSYNPQILNEYGEVIKTKEDTISEQEDAYTIDAPVWGVPAKEDIADTEPEIDLHHNTERKVTPNIPKTFSGIRYDELDTDKFFSQGAWVYGFNASQEGMYELLNNIPGSIDRFFDWAGEQTGLDTDDEGFFEESLQNLEYWLTKRARLTNPEYLGLQAPETFRGKLASAFASAPITVAQYIPATIALGPVGGFALTDAIRAAEPDASLFDIAEAAAWGGVLGKTLKWAQNYGLKTRVGIMGTAGFGSSWIQTAGLEPPENLSEEEKKAWKNSLSQDRYVNAIVMGVLGIPGRYKSNTGFLEGVKKEVTLEAVKKDFGRKTTEEVNKEQVNKDLEEIKIALEKGEYNADSIISQIVKENPELKITDLQLIQNIKDYAENIKRVDEFVKNDVAKEDFSVNKFEAQVKRIAKEYGILEAREYYNKYLEAKGFKPEFKVESDIIIPENIKVGDIIEVFDITGRKYKTKVTAKDKKSGLIKVKNQQGQDVVVNQSASATTINIRSSNYKFDIVKVDKPINELSKKELEIIKEKLESQKKLYEDTGTTKQLDFITIVRDLNAVKLRLKEGQKPPVTTTETKPLHKILKVNEKVLNERLSKKEKDLEVKEVEPKTVTFNKDESIYSNINTALFKETESRIANNPADVVLPIIKALPKYTTYLKNLKKSLTDTFGKTFNVYRLMDRSDFQQLSTKSSDKPLSVSLDLSIADKGSWVIGKSKLERETQARNENIVFPGSLKINDPVLVRMEIDAKSVLFKGDKSLSEIIIDGAKVNNKKIELIKDNKGLSKKQLSDNDKIKLEQYRYDLEVLLNNEVASANVKYRSIIPIIEKLHQERTILESIKKAEYPKSEIDVNTGKLKPIKEETIVNYNDHINKLINDWIAMDKVFLKDSKNNFIEFLNTLPSRKSRFKFPEEQQPVKSFMLVPWIKDKLNLLKSKETKYISDDLKLLTDLTKYLAKVNTIARFDKDSHSAIYDIIRFAEGGNTTAIQTLAIKVNSFKIVDWVLDNGKIHYKLELIPFKESRYRNIPLNKRLINQLEQYKPKFNEAREIWQWPNMPTQLPRVIEAGKLHAITTLKFEGKQGSFVGKLKGEEWLSHQQKEFTKLTSEIEKKLNVKLTDKLSEDPVDYKGTIPDPDWTATLKGEWRITEYEKGKGKYNKVVTKVKVDPVPKDTIATETRTSKIINIEDLKNVVFENKKIEATKQDLLDPDAQLLAIEQKRVELNVKEDGNVTISTTRKRKEKLSKEDIAVIDKRLKQIERMTDTAISTVSYADKVAQHVSGRFELSKYEFLADLLKPDGTPKYQDISHTYLYGFAGWLLPPRFMKKHPALQYASQRIGDYMNKIDREMEFFLYNLQARKLKFFEFDKESQKVGNIFSTGKVPVGTTLLSRSLYEPSNGGLLTRLNSVKESKEIINGKKGWERADEVVQAFFKIQRDKKALSEKENLPYDMKNKDGTFRYEVTELELKNTYKLDAEQILAFKDVRNTLNTLVNLYNAKTLKYGKLNGVSRESTINPIPNYVPSMFFGDARIFVNKKGQVDRAQKGEIKWEDLDVLLATGKENRASAELYIKSKEFTEQYPNANIYTKIGSNKRELRKKGTGDYDVTVYMVDRELVAGTSAYESIGQFSEAIRYLTRKGDIKGAETMAQAKEQLQASRGFPVHRLKKQNVRGAMGERIGKTSNIRDVENFMKGMQAYTEGLLRTTYGWEFRNDMMGRNGILEAKQMLEYPNTKVLVNRMIENATGNHTRAYEKVINNYTRRLFGERGLDKFFGYANVFGLSTSLLFFNVRFLESQGIQPYQMIIPKLRSLVRQKKLFSKNENGEGLILDAVMRSQKRMFKPEKEDFEFIDYLHDQGVLEAKFFQEFLGKDAMARGRFEVGGKSIPIWSFTKNLTMKSFVGRMESWSRLQASMMFYHLLRLSGRSKKFSQAEAAHLGDKYMVQYALHDRPMLFGSAGGGVLAKPFGLFKTFQYNYFAQLIEHIQMAQKGLKRFKKGEQGFKETYADMQGSIYFLTSMVLTAGMYGIIGIEQADKLLGMMKQKSLTESLTESDLPNYLLWGIPSSIQGVDLTTTLSAPGLGAGDLFSVPALDKLGLNPLKFGENRGLAQSFVTIGLKVLDPNATATRAEMQKFYKTLLPTSAHGFVELYYSGGGELPVLNENKNYGTINRDMKDWFSKLLLSSRSIKEARIFKQEYAKTLLNKKIDASLDGITMMAADLVVRGLPVPSFLFDKAAEYKVMPKEFYKRILNRIKLITTTLDQRNVPKKLTGRYLLEQELMGGTMNDNSTATGDNLIYNYNQHTNQVDAPDWGVPAN